MFRVLIFAALCAKYVEISEGKAVKIVEEPAVYRGINTYHQQRQASQVGKRIVARVKEQPFTGPSYFKRLDGKCFVLQHNGYKYELCPFHNVTQEEESPRWNAFSGMLGVWKEWDIVNNTFQAMLMTEGDICQGNKPRETKVILKCGEENKLKSVKEPNICKYELVFHTPLACPLDSLLVFPALSSDGQKEWLAIEKGLYHHELTLQGYNKHRQKLFVKAGFLPKDGTQEQKEVRQKPKGEVENMTDLAEGKVSIDSLGFRSLEHCSMAYKKLEDEVRKLRQLLNISKGAGFQSESHKTVQVQTYKNESLKLAHEREELHKNESLKPAHKREEPHKNESLKLAHGREEPHKNESLKTTQTQLHENESHGTGLGHRDKKESHRTAQEQTHRNELYKNAKSERNKSHKTQTVVTSVSPDDAQPKRNLSNHAHEKTRTVIASTTLHKDIIQEKGDNN